MKLCAIVEITDFVEMLQDMDIEACDVIDMGKIENLFPCRHVHRLFGSHRLDDIVHQPFDGGLPPIEGVWDRRNKMITGQFRIILAEGAERCLGCGVKIGVMNLVGTFAVFGKRPRVYEQPQCRAGPQHVKELDSEFNICRQHGTNDVCIIPFCCHSCKVQDNLGIELDDCWPIRGQDMPALRIWIMGLGILQINIGRQDLTIRAALHNHRDKMLPDKSGDSRQ